MEVKKRAILEEKQQEGFVHVFAKDISEETFIYRFTR
jgi:hypothetical protein